MGNNKYSCFLSYPANVDIKLLIDLLNNKGITVIDAYTTLSGSIIPRTNIKCIRDADFFCAIFKDDNKFPINIIYEIGIARGLNKPILILNIEDSKLPFELLDLPHINFIPKNIEYLDYYLDGFIKNRLSKIKRKNKINNLEKQKINNQNVNDYFSNIGNDYLNGKLDVNESLIHSHIIKILKSNNYIFDTESKDQLSDVTLWLDELDNIIVNPIIIEIKLGELDKNSIKRIENQLNNFLYNYGSTVGIIVYKSTGNKIPVINNNKFPLILWIELNEFINLIYSKQIGKFINIQRNVVAHSGSNLNHG